QGMLVFDIELLSIGE
ncbi:MAG TPA: hypothetical protein DEF51_49965, partial [Myxococcales bacterium]|nr:hypothetical protein [Myxococcales bacterium]